MDIVEELRQNRDSGAKRLVGEYKAGLMSLARRFCVNETDAEELVNATFAKVVASIDDYLEQSAFFAWMCQILTNLHRDGTRRKSNQMETFPGDVPERADESAQEEIFRNLDHSILRDAIRQLPDDQRELLLLHYFMDIPVAKIAKFLSIPNGTVFSRLHYARKALAAKLGAAAKKPGGKALLLAIALCAFTAAGAAGIARWSELSERAAAIFGSIGVAPRAAANDETSGTGGSSPVAATPTPVPPVPDVPFVPDVPSSISSKEPTMNATTRTAALGAATVLATTAASGGIKYWNNPDFRAFDVGDYVQNGLIANYDGIRNAGPDVPHTESPAQWLNCADTNRWPLLWCSYLWNESTSKYEWKKSNTSQGRWADDGFEFDGLAYWAKWADGNPVALSGNWTYQFGSDGTIPSQKGNTQYYLVPSSNWPKGSIGLRKNAGGGTSDNSVYGVDSELNTTRPYFTAPGGVLGYVNYIVDWSNAKKACITDGVERPSASGASVSLSASPSKSYTWFSLGGYHGYNDQTSIGGLECFTGTIHFFRIYDRALTDEELAWNRVVDEARYHGRVAPLPVVNAVIASNKAGVGGMEPAGEYAVAPEGHAFTAPATTTVGGNTYACTGCTVETWDGTAGAWGAVVLQDGVLSVSVAASEKKRITWQFSLVSGLVQYTPADYVQDGLLLHYDGERNAGLDRPHATGAATWANLASAGGNDLSLEVAFGQDAGEWRADGYRFERGSLFRSYEAVTLPSNQTVQIALDGNALDQDARVIGTWVNEPYLYHAAGIDFNKGAAISLRRDNNNSATGGNNWFDWPVHGYGNNARPDVCVVPGMPVQYVTAVLADTFGAVFLGTSVPTAQTDRWKADASRRDFTAGPPTAQAASGLAIGGEPSGSLSRFRGVIKNFRLYGRVLSDAELAYNREIDDARFWGILPVTNVVVCTSHSAFSGNERNFNYRVKGSYSFTAPAGNQTDSHGVEYAFDGYTLETWDAARQCWGAPERFEGASCTWSESSSPAKVRLTWQWRPVRGLRTAADYDLSDIVESGLVLHYDGKQNIGRESADVSNPTSAWSRVWANIADPRVFNLTRWNASAGAAGTWTDDGFAFANTTTAISTFWHSGTFLYPASFTAQVLVDGSSEDQVDDTCGYVFQGQQWNASAIALRRNSDYNYAFYYCADLSFGGTAVRPRFSHASKRYSFGTAVVSGRKAMFFEGTSLPTSGTEVQTANSDAAAFTTGHIDMGGNGSKQDFTGTVKSYRFYDRILSDAELERNRNVDAARYFGVLGVTNVLVAVREEDPVTPSPAVGAYYAEGSYTFTAENATGCRLYARDAAGEWVPAGEQRGGTFEWSAAAAPAGCVMIEWRKAHPFVMTVR